MKLTEPLTSDLRSRFTRADAALFIAILVVMSIGIGSYGLYEPHEAQYGGGAQEMLMRRDWITPYLNGSPELNKPPLFYWLIAIGYVLMGGFASPEFCARFPQVLIAVAGAFVAWRWAFELWGRRSARLAAVMLSVAAGWWMFSHQLLIDELLGTLYLASLFFLWRAIVSGGLAKWVLFYVLMALAVLAKGLLGIAFPVGVLVLYIVIRRKWSLIGQAHPFFGCLILGAIVGPWAFLFERNNPGALKYMVINEHFNRLFDMRVPHDYGVVQTDAATFLLITLIWLMPWGLFIPEVVAFVSRQLKSRQPSEPAISMIAEGTIDASDARREGILLLSIATLIVIVFFTVVPSRLVYYGLPAIPPFIVLCAGAFEDRISNPIRFGVLDCLGPLLCGAILLGVAPFVPALLGYIPEFSDVIGSKFGVSALALAAGLMLCGAGLMMKRRKILSALVALTALMCALEFYATAYLKSLDPIYSSKALVQELAPVLGDRFVWISEASDEVGATAGITYYLRQKGWPIQVFIVDIERRPRQAYPVPSGFLIDRGEFEEKWESEKPVLYVTDFARTNWITDPPLLPSDCQLVRVPHTGNRRVFANSAAAKILSNTRFATVPGSTPGVEISSAPGN